MQRDRCDDLSIRRTVGPEGWRLRRAHIARGMIGLAVVVILTAMLPSPAGAQQDLGHFCWTLNPFVDTLRLTVTQATGAAASLISMAGGRPSPPRGSRLPAGPARHLPAVGRRDRHG